MSYTEHPPCAALAPYVECYWSRVSTVIETPSHRVLPDGCMDLLFESTDGGAFVGAAIGVMSRPLVVSASAPARHVAVRFRPGKASVFLGLPAHELTDAAATADELGLRGLRPLRARLEDLPAPQDQVRALEAYLLGFLATHEVATDPYVDAVVDRIVAARGQVRVDALSDLAGITRQHLTRRFRQHVGLTTKTFARVVRFRAVLAQLRGQRAVDWLQLALDLGYYDQAHLIADFRAFAGESPTRFQISKTQGRGRR